MDPIMKEIRILAEKYQHSSNDEERKIASILFSVGGTYLIGGEELDSLMRTVSNHSSMLLGKIKEEQASRN